MKRFIILTLAIVLSGAAVAQQKQPAFAPPVDITMYLSGNVGEIRSNHFHSGIDIKTQGVTGKSVRSSAGGYISRIAVSPTGFGKAIYINHPNGTTTVYGHLDRFEERIAEYVRNEQYRRKSFAVDLYLSASQFPVRQNDLIAYSGNSGSSGGPHLHFEIRDQATQQPLNIISRGLMPGIADNEPPRFLKLWLIGVDTIRKTPVHRIIKEFNLKKTESGYTINGDTTVPVGSAAYFAVEVTDGKNGANNTMGLYAMKQTIDGKQNFGYATDRFSFDESRYVNTLAYYPLHVKSRYDVLRTYVSPNNELPIYKGVVNRGVIRLKDSAVHPVVIEITDDNGNSSSLRFNIVRGENGTPSPDTGGTPVWWAQSYTHRYEGMTLTIPAKALYESILLTVDTSPKPSQNAYSPLYNIHNEETPVQRPMTLSIRPEGLPENLRTKACLASINKRGERVYEGGSWQNGVVTVTTRTFGRYFVTTDTVAPGIAAQFVDGADLSGEQGFTLKVNDNLSGVKDWYATVDGAWVLMDYDPKSERLTHFFRDARYEKGKEHQFVIEVTDRKGNRSTFRRKFVW